MLEISGFDCAAHVQAARDGDQSKRTAAEEGDKDRDRHHLKRSLPCRSSIPRVKIGDHERMLVRLSCRLICHHRCLIFEFLRCFRRSVARQRKWHWHDMLHVSISLNSMWMQIDRIFLRIVSSFNNTLHNTHTKLIVKAIYQGL